MESTPRGRALSAAAARGAGAGLVGVAVMTLAEKVEQAATHRPDSYVPGRTMMALCGRSPSEQAHPCLANHAMHWGTGALLGALRGVWSAVGLRGPRANLAHAVTRLSFDQTMENATGAGAPPHTWPQWEQMLDMLHKSVYAFATGTVADRLIAGNLESHRGRTSH